MKNDNKQTIKEFKKKYMPKRGVGGILAFIAVDILLCAIAYLLASWMIYFDPLLHAQWGLFKQYAWLCGLVSVAVTVVALGVFDCYTPMWRYASRHELIKMACAYISTVVVLTIFKYASIIISNIVGVEGYNYWESHIVIYALFSLLFCASWRFIFAISSVARRTFAKNKRQKFMRVVVLGAGLTGSVIVGKFVNNAHYGCIPVAILDDDENKVGHKLYGVKITGAISEIKDTCKKYSADMIVIAINNITKSQLRAIYNKCFETGLPVKMVPDISDAEEVSTKTLSMQDIRIEDLLGREQFEVKRELMDIAVKDKVVCVTGGAGSIGSELCRQALNFGCKHLIIVDYHENGMFFLNQEFKDKYDTSRYTLEIATVREKESILDVFRRYKPEVVFHAAAYKHVPMMEIAPTEAIKTNLFGTKNVIECAEEVGVEKFVLISTDKAVNPSSVMGATKRIAEMLIETRGKRFKMKMAAVRFGNVLGSNGSVVPIFLQQIKQGGPITLTHREIKRYFMSIPEAVKLVLQTGAFASSGEIFVLDMGDPVYIYDLACALIRLNGLEPEVDIPIQVTGLRAGEKLFEELRYDKESVDATAHEGVFVNKMQKIDEEEFDKVLEEFRILADNEDESGIVKKIFAVVPNEYRK